MLDFQESISKVNKLRDNDVGIVHLHVDRWRYVRKHVPNEETVSVGSWECDKCGFLVECGQCLFLCVWLGSWTGLILQRNGDFLQDRLLETIQLKGNRRDKILGPPCKATNVRIKENQWNRKDLKINLIKGRNKKLAIYHKQQR